MVVIKIFAITLSLLSMVTSEPPVGYHYQPNYSPNVIPPLTNTYLPPKTGFGLPNSYLPPNSFTGNGNYDHGGQNDHHKDHDSEPKSYEFGYSVKDAKSGNDYDRKETSDGHVVRGEYRVQLPDGRVQIVTYHADWKTGFHADVRYEGQARYPEPSNQGYNYNVPDFTGSLTGFHGNHQYQPTTSYGPPAYH
ncbi:pro-resilin-like [Danaus plexippus]|uniref:pro-resilin-like n=1 Tax=Danaus plexippus TaxID=13037 RepID=UPI002AB11F9E|nr:pro-resilin-like [Danaus plexippus]